MTFEAWTVFATFWVVFVTSPGPNAVNCIGNGMTLGFRRGLIGVLAILVQATAFMLLAAAGIGALLAASVTAFTILRFGGAAFLIWMGVRAWLRAGDPPPKETRVRGGAGIFLRALAVATFNPKSIAGHIAALSQFVNPAVPVGDQLYAILPTALAITAASYATYTYLGHVMGRAALSAIFHVAVRRVIAVCFVVYGVALGATGAPAGISAR